MLHTLVLGGAGFLGTNLIRCLEQKPDVQITAADIRPFSSHSFSQPKKIRFLQGDLQDPHFILQCIKGQDIIFHCAAQSSHLLSMQYPYQDVETNILLSLRLLETIRHHQPRAILIYPSSTTVSGKLKDDLSDENHPERPLDFYSAHKALAEKYHLIYHHRYGIRTIVLRFSNLFGPFGHPGPEYNFINHFLHCALRNRPLKIFGNGEQKRNVLFVEDAAELMWKAAHSSSMAGDIFLATSSYHHSVKEIAEAIVEVFGRGEIRFTPWPEKRWPLEIGDALFSSEKIRAVMGWNPSFNLIDGLKQTRNILEENKILRTSS